MLCRTQFIFSDEQRAAWADGLMKLLASWHTNKCHTVFSTPTQLLESLLSPLSSSRCFVTSPSFIMTFRTCWPCKKTKNKNKANDIWLCALPVKRWRYKTFVALRITRRENLDSNPLLGLESAVNAKKLPNGKSDDDSRGTGAGHSFFFFFLNHRRGWCLWRKANAFPQSSSLFGPLLPQWLQWLKAQICSLPGCSTKFGRSSLWVIKYHVLIIKMGAVERLKIAFQFMPSLMLHVQQMRRSDVVKEEETEQPLHGDSSLVISWTWTSSASELLISSAADEKLTALQLWKI